MGLETELNGLINLMFCLLVPQAWSLTLQDFLRLPEVSHTLKGTSSPQTPPMWPQPHLPAKKSSLEWFGQDSDFTLRERRESDDWVPASHAGSLVPIVIHEHDLEGTSWTLLDVAPNLKRQISPKFQNMGFQSLHLAPVALSLVWESASFTSLGSNWKWKLGCQPWWTERGKDGSKGLGECAQEEPEIFAWTKPRDDSDTF